MKNKRVFSSLITFSIFSFFLLCHGNSSAFWVWTPGSKNAVNPKFAVKDTPEDQFEWAMRFFNNHEYKRAAEEFLRLTEHYRDSDIAPEAQYFAGRSYEELGKYYFAYQNYQKTVDNYPYTRRLEEIIEREFNIALIFQNKEEPRLMDLELNVSLDKAIEIYKKIVANSSFGEYADKSLFNMAVCYRRLQKYKESIDVYETLITDYPSSPLLQEAKYELASTTYEAALDPEYDQESTDEALEKFERISRTTPVPAIAKEADKVINELKNRKADSILKIAGFYEKQKKYPSAVIYYKEVIKKYPDTRAAVMAEEKISVLEKKD